MLSVTLGEDACSPHATLMLSERISMVQATHALLWLPAAVSGEDMAQALKTDVLVLNHDWTGAGEG